MSIFIPPIHFIINDESSMPNEARRKRSKIEFIRFEVQRKPHELFVHVHPMTMLMAKYAFTAILGLIAWCSATVPFLLSMVLACVIGIVFPWPCRLAQRIAKLGWRSLLSYTGGSASHNSTLLALSIAAIGAWYAPFLAGVVIGQQAGCVLRDFVRQNMGSESEALLIQTLVRGGRMSINTILIFLRLFFSGFQKWRKMMVGLHVVVQDIKGLQPFTISELPDHNDEYCLTINSNLAEMAQYALKGIVIAWSLVNAPYYFIGMAIVGGTCGEALQNINEKIFEFWNKETHQHLHEPCHARKVGIGAAIALASYIFPAPLAIMAGQLTGSIIREHVDKTDWSRPRKNEVSLSDSQ
ncbi:MAG: hypothetical protein Q8K75_02505 [Chlamydiales bacterium]|nr:hypothetical protein [Chlamydiales bacterium]